MELRDRITINPDICHGKPTVRGLRYPVSMFVELTSAGMTEDEILDDYPDLESLSRNSTRALHKQGGGGKIHGVNKPSPRARLSP